MKRLLILLSFFCLQSVQIVFSQAKLQDPLPHDPNVIIGKLPNGITYYIRYNQEPKKQASFYIIRDAGSLLENDDQNGLAHFLEHMAFQGTKNFPDKGIINTLERHGVSFGADINAYTSQNETVYNLSAIPTDNEALLDTCLLILHDWSYYLTLDNEEIDKERGVINEEWRTGINASSRISKQILPVIFKDSQYAKRDVIGSMDVVKNFSYQALKDFYHEWYRTDLEAIAVVGDFDIKKMEQKIKNIMSKVPAMNNPKPRPFFEIPLHDSTYYCLATDKEAQSSSVGLTTILPNQPNKSKNTHAYLKDKIIISFYNGMISTRMAELMQQADPPFLGGSIGFTSMVRGYNSYDISTTAKPNQEDLAFETILTVNERVKRFGFTSGELERMKINMLTNIESAYKQKDKITNESYIKEMQSHFLEQEQIVDMEYYYQYIKQLIPTITVEEVSAKAQEWNTPTNRVIVISGPSENAKHLSEQEVLAIMEKVANADLTPYEDKITDASLISETLKGSKIIKTRKLPQFDAVEWTLANKVKVVFRKADYDKDAVALASYSKGGSSLYDIDLLPSADNTAAFVEGFGLGDFDVMTLEKMLTGKIANSGVSINGMSEGVSGSCIPADFETMMQLIYLRFEKPRFDKDIFQSIISSNRMMLPNMMKNPQKIMQDSIQLITSNYNKRSLLFNEEYINQISLENIEKIYRDRIKDASDFTFFIVGNIDESTVKPMVEKYIGSLKSEYRKETWRDNKVRGPKGKVVKEIEIQLEEPKSTVIANFRKKMPFSIYNNFCNNILKGILDTRYLENIREKEGGTYGVSVQEGSFREPYSEYSMTVSFDCEPEKVNYLKSLIYTEIEKIQQKAPSEEEMTKVTSSIAKGRDQSKNHNSFWLSTISTYYINGINMADPKNYEDILAKIKPNDIQEFARTLFKDCDNIDLIFKPKK